MEIVSSPQLHQDIARWVDARIPGDHHRMPHDGAVAIGFIENGKPIAGAIFEHYARWNIFAAIAIEKGHGLPRRACRALCEYPFVQLECLRITALVASRNIRSIDFLVRFGFVYEGTMLNATPTDSHLVFGLLKKDCKWITEQQRNAISPA